MAVVDRRQQVLQAATKSFSLFGYKATTMDQVAKIANVGKGTIYTFFTNKEQLFDEILRDVILEMKMIAEREIRRDKPFLIICTVCWMPCWNFGANMSYSSSSPRRVWTSERRRLVKDSTRSRVWCLNIWNGRWSRPFVKGKSNPAIPRLCRW